MEALLNRWRGTGVIFSIFNFKLIGNIIYAIYIALLIGLLTCAYDILLPFTTLILQGTENTYVFTNSQLFSSLSFAFIGSGLYIAGESFAWGKWVGWLTDYDRQAVKDYDNDDGRNFPYIHFMAQYIVKQEVNYTRYCEVALMIRGFIWWTPLLILLGLIGLLSWYMAVVNSLILSVGFPIACYIGNMLKIELRSKYLNLSRGWENQEVVYGFIQFVCITLTILIYKVYNGI